MEYPLLKMQMTLTICVLITTFSKITSIAAADNVFYMDQSSHAGQNAQQCDSHPGSARFDCLPGAMLATEKQCEQRSCCWKPSSNTNSNSYNLTRTVNVPFCYFPDDYKGYTIIRKDNTDFGLSATLQRSTSSGWPGDVQQLKLDIMLETKTRLHFKIYDPNNKRYEVPIPTPKVEGQAAITDYKVELKDSPFGIKVTRKVDSSILFDSTMTGAPLLFADQFLQLSTAVPGGLLYGIGEHLTPLLINASHQWQQLSMWARDAEPEVGNNLYSSHPFFLSLEKHGNAHGVFLLNSNAMDVDIQPMPALTFRTIGGILDFYVLTGPTPADVILQYTDIVGKPAMPPYWSLGFHLCRYGYNSIEETKKVINRNKAIGIPYDVQWNDIDYMHRFQDWTYDHVTYKGLPSLVDSLHDDGMRYIMIIDPAISNEYPGQYPPYDEGVKDGIFILNATGQLLVGSVWPGATVFPDFTNPKAADWWYRQAKAFHDQVAYDGLWIDMNEPSNFMYGSSRGCTGNKLDQPPYVPGIAGSGKLPDRTVCPSARQYLSSHYNLHNMYGMTEAIASHSALTRIRNKRSIVISRSTFPSHGHYAGHWTGDVSANWEQLYYTIPAILKFNMFGIPMVGADICGFAGDTTEELCTRWMQLGAFYPFMRNHNDLHSRDQDPAVWSAAAQKAMKIALEMRYMLLPYMYTLFHHNNHTGYPVVNPLFFNFPKDANTYTIDHQFMWGNGLLVSPVLKQGETSIQAYFPKGEWYDLNLQFKPLHGEGQWHKLDAQLDRINVHIHGGHIIPAQQPAVTTTKARTQDFYLFVANNSTHEAVGDLFWDDGESLDVMRTGEYNYLTFHNMAGHMTSQVVHSGYTANPMMLGAIYVLGTNRPASVTVNGKPETFKYSQENMLLDIQLVKPVNLLQELDVKWH